MAGAWSLPGWTGCPAQLGLVTHSGVDQHCSELGLMVLGTSHAMYYPVASSPDRLCSRFTCEERSSVTAQGPPGVEVAGFSPGARLDEELSWPGWYLWLWVHGALPLREGQPPLSHGQPAWRTVGCPAALMEQSSRVGEGRRRSQTWVCSCPFLTE